MTAATTSAVPMATTGLTTEETESLLDLEVSSALEPVEEEIAGEATQPPALLEHSLAGLVIFAVLLVGGGIASVVMVGSVGAGLALACLVGGVSGLLVSAL